MLCYVLLSNEVNQAYAHIYPLYFGLPSHPTTRPLTRSPCRSSQSTKLSCPCYTAGYFTHCSEYIC